MSTFRMNALRERYTQLEELIDLKNNEIRQMYNSREYLKQQLILHELQELTDTYKESVIKRLGRLKVYIDTSEMYDAKYTFYKVEQPRSEGLPIHDPLDWQIVDYTLNGKVYIEILIYVSKPSVSKFICEWLKRNIPLLEYSRSLSSFTSTFHYEHYHEE